MADDLDPEQRAVKEQALAEAGEVIAESLARQMRRAPQEAAREALGRSATPERLAAWMARHRGADRG